MELQEQQPLQILNARIAGTALGFDGAAMFGNLHLQAQNSGVTFGGYLLYIAPSTKADEERQTAWGMEYISAILRTVGVASWESLNGQALRIAVAGNQIIGIGNLIDDVWFYPNQLGAVHDARADEQAMAFAKLREFNENLAKFNEAGAPQNDAPKAEPEPDPAVAGQDGEPVRKPRTPKVAKVKK